MHRFYCPQADLASKVIVITDPHEIHHIKDVLRLKKGSEVCVFNGKGGEALAMIEEVRDTAVRLQVRSVLEKGKEGRPRIILACAVPKKAKFEFILEKATELGVDVLIPLKTKRTEVIFSGDKQRSKQERFQKVVQNAAKQCGRADIPRISLMTPLAEALKGLDPQGLAVIPSLNGHNSPIREVLDKHQKPVSVTFLIGPEGDFTPDEVALAQEHGCIPVSLGPTVLKVDTAALAVLALANFYWD
ncbi:16S rRNA (uracil(1498)-N(3))-methyltransferase [Phenylobacterium sp.]|uniref:RsmE family RNA methyltransferase n=1 Tax=Phenylobacterium sp. TaxID=1871053 RepID=UPI0027186BA1|nr:RsmE family RNA methyltransferase [Phenylobacterium sp.]MDO8801766.1 RsmE family RNA methyltransferase [Phenylobacterium sp.]